MGHMALACLHRPASPASPSPFPRATHADRLAQLAVLRLCAGQLVLGLAQALVGGVQPAGREGREREGGSRWTCLVMKEGSLSTAEGRRLVGLPRAKQHPAPAAPLPRRRASPAPLPAPHLCRSAPCCASSFCASSSLALSAACSSSSLVARCGGGREEEHDSWGRHQARPPNRAASNPAACQLLPCTSGISHHPSLAACPATPAATAHLRGALLCLLGGPLRCRQRLGRRLLALHALVHLSCKAWGGRVVRHWRKVQVTSAVCHRSCLQAAIDWAAPACKPTTSPLPTLRRCSSSSCCTAAIRSSAAATSLAAFSEAWVAEAFICGD